MAERIVCKTEDGIEISGTWLAPSEAKASVLLLHMWPADRTSWIEFQSRLAEHQIASLAIDLRGHGESVCSERQQDAKGMRLDVEASLEWMREKGMTARGIVGASIGANLALQAMAEHKELVAGCLLSAGIEYHGVTTLDASAHVSPEQALLVIASLVDDQESADASRKIVDVSTSKNASLELLKNVGHGTRMFDADPNLLIRIVEWLKRNMANT